MKNIYNYAVLPILTIIFLTSKKFILNSLPNKDYIQYKIKNEFTLFTFVLLSFIINVFIYLKYFKIIKKKNPIYNYLSINSKLNQKEIERRIELNKKKKIEWEEEKNNKILKFNEEIKKFIDPILIYFIFDFFLMIFFKVFIFNLFLNYICVKAIGIFNFWKLLKILVFLKSQKFWHKISIFFLTLLCFFKFITNMLEALTFYDFKIYGIFTFLMVMCGCASFRFFKRFLIFKQVCYTLQILFTKN